MKRRWRPLLFLTGGLAAAAAAFWFTQAGLAVILLNRFSGGVVSVERAEGTLLSGINFYGVVVTRPEFRLKASEIFLHPDITGLLSGRVELSEARLVSPSLIVNTVEKGREAGLLPAAFPVRLITISGGALGYGGRDVSGVDCRISFDGERLEILSCGGDSAGVSSAFSGAYSAGSASLRGQLSYPVYKTVINFKASLLGRRCAVSGEGSAGGVPLKLEGELSGNDWRAGLSLKKPLSLNALHASLPSVRIRSANVSASGSGFALRDVHAGGKFSITEEAGGAAEGAFEATPGSASLRAVYEYRGMTGALQASVRGGLLTGAWRTEGSGNLEFPGGKELSFHDAKASCSLGGALKEPAAVCEGGAGGISFGDFASGALDFTGNITAGRPEKFQFVSSLQTPSVYGVRLDSASLSAEGSTGANAFVIEASYRENTIRLDGSSSLQKDIWHTVINGVSVSKVPGWKLCSPSVVALSKGKAEVSGFCLVSGVSRIDVSGLFKAPFPEKLHASLSDFDLSGLTKAGFRRAMGGVVSLSADYPDAAGNEGRFSVSAEKLQLEGLDLGAASACGTFGPGKARLEKFEWLLYGGTARAYGRADLSGAAVEGELAVIASSMNVAPLLALWPNVSAPEIWINGETRLSLVGGVLKNTGNIRLSAPRLALTSLGLELNDLAAYFESRDLASMAISASARGGKNETITASGPVSAAGPELTIRTSKLSLDHPAGLSGTVASEMLLAGTWKEPELSGKAELREARFEMGKWRKFEPPVERSDYYARMSLDLNISAERNVWYREGASSVEVKGGLLLKKDHYRQAVAVGNVDAIKGYYVYLGNTFTVQSGRITFTGENPPNPDIAVTAVSEERGRPVKIYFNASGKARDPMVTLTSDPPMDQQDIISFLITGRLLYQSSQESGAGGQPGSPGSNVAAQNIAAGYISQQAALAFGRKLDIDVLSLKVNAENRADVTVGRYVTKDLFISYGQALGQGGEKRVSAEYSLTKHLSLEGRNSSDGRYVADFLFKYGIK